MRVQMGGPRPAVQTRTSQSLGLVEVAGGCAVRRGIRGKCKGGECVQDERKRRARRASNRQKLEPKTLGFVGSPRSRWRSML